MRCNPISGRADGPTNVTHFNSVLAWDVRCYVVYVVYVLENLILRRRSVHFSVKNGCEKDCINCYWVACIARTSSNDTILSYCRRMNIVQFYGVQNGSSTPELFQLFLYVIKLFIIVDTAREIQLKTKCVLIHTCSIMYVAGRV